MRRLRERLTFANVTAGLALFIALGGTSYAAVTLPRNSVGANQIRTGAIRSAEIKDRAIGAKDLTVGARRFLRSQEGAQGPRGPEGPQGERGPQGPPGPGQGSVTITIKSAPGTVGRKTDPDLAATAQATATCDAGQKVTGGGVNLDNNVVTTVHDTYPVGASQWRATVANDDDASAHNFTVYAICAT